MGIVNFGTPDGNEILRGMRVTETAKLSYNLLPTATKNCRPTALNRVLGEIKVVMLPLVS